MVSGHLSSKSTVEFARIKSKNRRKFYKRVLRFERKYMAVLEACELVDENSVQLMKEMMIDKNIGHF
ncbi:hypothetical protein PHMEG_00031080 [Phytophthora megakarya]|uniref:Uncharacterized protein n=1 Tax=Phytophthora megakarya TaxID=4795 RepID=A0A225UZI7_9STRA|nr:hypothetical protein PHMEG_00031080 [Phytophthora megakarya]